MQTYAAGSVIAFDPITPGSPVCPNSCEGMSQDDGFPAVVRMIDNAWPGNPTVEQWLADYDAGTANVPTQHNIDRNIELYRLGSETWDFGNKPLSDEYVNIGGNPSSLAPGFHQFFTSMGMDVGPLYSDETTTETAEVTTSGTTAKAATRTAATETAAPGAAKAEAAEARAAEAEASEAQAPEKAEKPAAPRIDAVAPVKMIVPLPRGTMTFAASRPARKPAKAAISHTLR